MYHCVYSMSVYQCCHQMKCLEIENQTATFDFFQNKTEIFYLTTRKGVACWLYYCNNSMFLIFSLFSYPSLHLSIPKSNTLFQTITNYFLSLWIWILVELIQHLSITKLKLGQQLHDWTSFPLCFENVWHPKGQHSNCLKLIMTQMWMLLNKLYLMEHLSGLARLLAQVSQADKKWDWASIRQNNKQFTKDNSCKGSWQLCCSIYQK